MPFLGCFEIEHRTRTHLEDLRRQADTERELAQAGIAQTRRALSVTMLPALWVVVQNVRSRPS